MKVVISVLALVLLSTFCHGALVIARLEPLEWFRDSILSTQISGIAQVILSMVILVILFLGLIVSTPPEMYNEKIDEIKKEQKKNQKLEERAKPKLEIRLIEGGDTYRQTRPISYDGIIVRQQTIFRVSIHNVSSAESIDGISVVLSNTEPRALQYIPAELHSMNDANKTLNAGGSLFIDVLGVEKWSDNSGVHRRLFWYFDHSPIRDLDKIEMRDYAISIAASGKGSPLRSRDFRFLIGDLDTYQFIALQDSGGANNDNETNENSIR